MENERDPELIRMQMQQTRDHLTEKVEGVEALVTNTVKQTAEAVTDTVTEVKEAVSDTVEGVKEVVSDTVEGVRSFFDIRDHVENHPWLMFLGAAGLSFLTTKLVMGGRAGVSPRPRPEAYGEATVHVTAAEPEPREAESPGLLSGLTEKLGPAATKLKEMGLGYTLAVVDKLLTEHLPEQWRGQVHETIDSLTRSIGGKPMKDWKSSDDENQSAAYQPGPTTQY
jgi:gas vesicle protein